MKNKRAISTLYKLTILLLIATLTNCSEQETEVAPDPRDLFVGTYTSNTNRYCNNEESIISKIAYGEKQNSVIWTNILGEEGSDDDVTATISGMMISVSKQQIGPFEFEASGQLLANGSIEISSIAIQGVATIWCDYEYQSSK